MQGEPCTSIHDLIDSFHNCELHPAAKAQELRRRVQILERLLKDARADLAVAEAERCDQPHVNGERHYEAIEGEFPPLNAPEAVADVSSQAWSVHVVNAAMPIVALDENGHVTNWNSKAEEVFNCSAVEASGRPFVNFFAQSDEWDDFDSLLSHAAARPVLSRESSVGEESEKQDREASDASAAETQDVTGKPHEQAEEEVQNSDGDDDLPESQGGRMVSQPTCDSLDVHLSERDSLEHPQGADMHSESEQEQDQVQSIESTEKKDPIEDEDTDESTAKVAGAEDDSRSEPSRHQYFQVHLQNATCRRGAWRNLVFDISSPSCIPLEENPRGGYLAIGRAASRAAREQQKAERVAEDLTRLLQTVNVSIISVDVNGVVTGWNEKAERLTGYCRDEALGKNFINAFIHEEFADSLRQLMQEAFEGRENVNHELSLFTKANQRREILLSATTRRNDAGNATSVLLVAQDITYLRSESKMLANYLQICGAAVWSLSGCASTGTVLQRKTKDIEHLMSQQAKMDTSDPRMVLWRTSFVSILNVMCQNLWSSTRAAPPNGSTPQTSFEYEFCFEAANGGVKWYKVQGHLTETVNRRNHNEFEVIGLLHDVTSMFIQKVIGDAWQKWWSRMCLMVFDATLLVDTQEYRVLNAWGEEKVFGCKLQSNYPILQLIKPEDFESLKRAFSEATLQGSERGRTLHLLRPGGDGKEMPAKCFLLGGEQENVNECMMGIRMQVTLDKQLWDVAKPSSVLTLDDLARLSSGLKRGHRSPCRPRSTRNRTPVEGRGHSGAARSGAKSQSLMSIPEDLHGESEDSDHESLSAKSSKSDTAEELDFSESSDGSDVGVCNSTRSPYASLSEGALRFKERPSEKQPGGGPGTPAPRTGPLVVKVSWGKKKFDVNLENFESVTAFREHILEMTGVPTERQTLILTGRRLPMGYEDSDMSWAELIAKAKPGGQLMMMGSRGPAAPPEGARAPEGMPAEAPQASVVAEDAAEDADPEND